MFGGESGVNAGKDNITRREALVVVAKAPRPGAVKTRLARAVGEETAATLYRAFLEDTLATAAALGSRRPGIETVLYYAPEEAAPELELLAPHVSLFVPQVEGDLGLRLAAVVDALFAAGYDAVVAIGADSPTLPVEALDGAFDALVSSGRVVLGPTSDGGYYLVGVDRPELRIFDEIPWSTDRVLETTRDRALAFGLEVALLPAWYDVDEAGDLDRLRTDLAADARLAPHTRAALDRVGCGS